MIGATALSIQWVDTPGHWTWISVPDSRFVLHPFFFIFSMGNERDQYISLLLFLYRNKGIDFTFRGWVYVHSVQILGMM